MAKRFGCAFLSLVALLLLCAGSVSGISSTEAKSIKKVVSVVYDDSGSMNNSNEDWAYASYSLQNMMALMNARDDLSVVKMSKPSQVISFDISTNAARSESIKTVEGWGAKGGTPFAAVDTAVNWLKTKKSEYADSQSVEFWLVVITDGSFETGYPSDMTAYLTDLKDTMGNSKYEGIFVAVGNDVPSSTCNDWTSVTGNHLITATNSDDIVNAMAEVSGLILGQGGKSTDVSVSTTPDGMGLTFTSHLPLKKFIVYEQNQSAGITSITVNGVNVKPIADFSAAKPGQGSITSRTIHCESENADFIPAGDITIRFDSPVNASSSNSLKILTEAAVNVKLTVLDKAGNEIVDLNEASLVEGDTVDFVATVVSYIDGSAIDLRNWRSSLSAQLIVNDQRIDMEYNPTDNAFYGAFPIQSGCNLAYSIVTLPGYFRAKSDIANIYPIEIVENTTATVSTSTIEIPYKYCDEFEEVGAFTYTISGGSINGICDFQFNDLPAGITASVNGIFADENGKLSVKLRNDVPADVKFYRNKEYTKKKDTTVTIDVTTNQYELKWQEGSITEIILKPVPRSITLEPIGTKHTDTLKFNNLDRKVIYRVAVLANGEYMTEAELKSLAISTTSVKGIDFKCEVVPYEDYYVLEISCDQTKHNFLVATGKLSTELSVTTAYGEEPEVAELPFRVKDGLIKYILPVLALLLIVFLLGYLPCFKKRLPDKRYHIQANGEAEAIYVKHITRILPYVTEKGGGSDLSLIATSNKNKVSVVYNFYSDQTVLLDGEQIPEGTKRFDLALDSQLQVNEANRQTVYSYCDSRSDTSFDDEFGSFDSTDDMFGSDSFDSNDNNSSDDDFFR